MALGGAWRLPRPRARGAPYFTRNQIARVLHHVGTLLELKGANPFRTRSYFNASRMLSTSSADLGELVASGEIFELKGIGKGLGSAITEAVESGGWMRDWVSLFEDTPAGLIEMLDIPNLGPKRIKQLRDELGVASIAELAEACEAGQVEELKGFGAKSQQRILEGIALLKRFRSRRRMNIGQMYGMAFTSRVANLAGVEQAQLAGSVRRQRETIGDLDLVVSALPEVHEEVSAAILSLPGIVDVKGAGDSKISLILDTSLFEGDFSLGNIDENVLDAIGGEDYEALEASGTIDAQVRLVPPHVFPFTLAYFTGSKEHNVAMRQRALDRGLRLNEFGLFPLAKIGDLKGMEAAQYSIQAADETDIYAELEMAWVPPELREDMGEIAAAVDADLPELVGEEDIKGAFHNHTTLSDGQASLEQMADEARRLGWSYLGISDHSQSLRIANGAQASDLLAQGEVIRRYNEEWKAEGVDFRLFHGVESDILADGRLDYSDQVLDELDYVVASVHAITRWKGRDEEENTEDLIKAVEQPHTTMLGHPTGRILQGRDGYEVDMHAVLRSMAALNAEGRFKAVELNASPYRLDLDWRLCKYAKELGVPVSINPDAHDLAGLQDVSYGVAIARKGWLSARDVLNSSSAEEIAELFARGG